MSGFRIGSASEFVSLVLEESFAQSGWGDADIEIAVSGFTGRVSAGFEAPDFERFLRSLQALHTSLAGTAVLAPFERQFELELRGNGRGRIAVTGEANWRDNKLSFEFELDQTFLADPLRDLGAIVAAHAARGAKK
jgi:hypothetical protein